MLCVCALVRAFARVWLFEDERARSHVRECVRRCVRMGNLSVGFCSSYAVCFRPFGETYVLYGVFCFGFHLLKDTLGRAWVVFLHRLEMGYSLGTSSLIDSWFTTINLYPQNSQVASMESYDS